VFEGFEEKRITTTETGIHLKLGGSGPPLLLLHGYPQTHFMWHAVADRLAETFTLVMPDLRGYGRSGKPASRRDHAPYAKRAMARDMVEVMDALGFERFFLAGHDRGGRVAHRLAIDHRQRVARLMVLDIAPTREMYRHTDEAFARAYWHWFFLIQPPPLPERMIGADPTSYVLLRMGAHAAGLAPFAAEALADYIACFNDPEAIRASCEDYRAAASLDIAHDDADDAAAGEGGDARLAMPLHAIWGADGVIERCFDCLALWRRRAREVTGRALPAGHFLAEELPDAVAEEMRAFFTDPVRG